MTYSESKPIYDTYKEIIRKIINAKSYKQYAEAEIDALDKEILVGFESIRNQLLIEKNWKD